MINITRSPIIPDSLNTPEIREYINSMIAHLNDDKNNPKPEKPASYRTSDLLEAFDRDFCSKCYLTEMKFSNSWAMDIEHFIPQNEQPDLVYEWTNLFPADHYSNMLKPRNTPVGGYLSPCDPNDDVETEIAYSLSAYGESPDFTAVNAENQKSVNTATLLKRVHNGHDYNTKMATASLRHAIHKKYIEILKTTVEWYKSVDGTQEKEQAKRELKDLLSRDSSFTMLCRSIPAVQQLPNDILD
jgi:hypothetical protein